MSNWRFAVQDVGPELRSEGELSLAVARWLDAGSVNAPTDG